MTQHMGMMDFSDEDGKEEEEVVGHLQLLPPFNRTLGWTIKEFKDGERRDRMTHNTQQATSGCPTDRCAQSLNFCPGKKLLRADIPVGSSPFRLVSLDKCVIFST